VLFLSRVLTERIALFHRCDEFKFPQNQFQKTGRKPINKGIEANKKLKIAKNSARNNHQSDESLVVISFYLRLISNHARI